MKILPAILVLIGLAQAQTPARYHSGKLLQSESVQCLVAHSQTGTAPAASVDCQEYVLEGSRVLFHFRAQDPKHAVPLPVGKIVLYRIEEGRFLVHAGNQDREFVVVSMEPRDSRESSTSSVKLNHLQ